MLTAERLFAERGLDGVSLRQIGVAAENGNHSVVQYHFGSKDQLVRSIFEYRLPHLNARRRLLVARRHPEDLRAAVECYVLPILEQGEEEGSHYLGFVAMLQQQADPRLFDGVPEELLAPTREFRGLIGELLDHDPGPASLTSHQRGDRVQRPCVGPS